MEPAAFPRRPAGRAPACHRHAVAVLGRDPGRAAPPPRAADRWSRAAGSSSWPLRSV